MAEPYQYTFANGDTIQLRSLEEAVQLRSLEGSVRVATLRQGERQPEVQADIKSNGETLPVEREEPDVMEPEQHEQTISRQKGSRERTSDREVMLNIYKKLSKAQKRILGEIRAGKVSRPTLEERYPTRPSFKNAFDGISRMCKRFGARLTQLVESKHLPKTGPSRTLYYYPGPLLKLATWIQPSAPAKSTPPSDGRTTEEGIFRAFCGRISHNLRTTLLLIKKQPGISLDKIQEHLGLPTINGASGVIGKLRNTLRNLALDPDKVFTITHDTRRGIYRYYPEKLLQEYGGLAE